jgi:hypothetical protein
MNTISYDATMSAMATLLNYINGSTYDAQMTLQHKDCRHNMDQVYDQCCNSKKITNADCQCFYANLKALEPVIETDDDPEYTRNYNELVKCFRDVRWEPHVPVIIMHAFF